MEVIVEIFQGIVHEVTLFQFKQDAGQYYEQQGGYTQDEYGKEEIKWFQDVVVHNMPIESVEETKGKDDNG